MGVIDQIGSALASGLSSTIGGIPGAIVNFGLNSLMQDQQVNKSKELMKYQWDNFQSPKAQVESMAAAGLNPAVTLGGHGSFASPNAVMPSSNAPIQVDGVAAMLGSLTQLKKVDKDNELVDAEIYKTLAEKGLIDEQRHGQAIANTIAMEYGDKEAAARIANLGAQAALYASQEKLSDAEKSLTDLKGETEKVYKELVGKNKLKAALEVKNYQRYIDSVVSSNRAGANLANKQAKLAEANTAGQEILNEIHGSESGKQALLDELEQRARYLKKQGELSDATRDYLSKLAVLVEKDADWYEWNQILNSADKISGIVFDGIDRFTKLGMLKNASRPDMEATEQVRFDKDGNYIGHTETKRVRSKQ